LPLLPLLRGLCMVAAAPKASAKMSGNLVSFGYAVGNILSSVALVLVNKQVFKAGFLFPMTLTTFHFGFTIGFYEMLRCGGAFENPDPPLPQLEKFKVALAGFASIGFMNLSLNANSVGFYQITKLVLVPITLIINAFFYSTYTSTKVKLSLTILLLGVGVATVTDVQLRPIGLMWGSLAVLSTAVFQIWQGTKQKEFGISAMQLQSSIATWQTIQSAAAAAFAECMCWDGGECSTATGYITAVFAGDLEKMRIFKIVLGTCFLALGVNFCSFGLIGRTGPITFQVVGHAKTCLVLVGGYLFFPMTGTMQQLYNNVMGVSVAMVGVVLYGHVKHASGQNEPDCFDCLCPGVVLSVIEPNYAKVNPSETEGLKPASNS